jgi:hypothetical protein
MPPDPRPKHDRRRLTAQSIGCRVTCAVASIERSGIRRLFWIAVALYGSGAGNSAADIAAYYANSANGLLQRLQRSGHVRCLGGSRY